MFALTPAARTWTYVIAFTVATLTVAAVIILVAIGAADPATVKDIGLWVLGILGIGGHGLAVANRPTKNAGS